jgi:hypothetical protein
MFFRTRPPFPPSRPHPPPIPPPHPNN